MAEFIPVEKFPHNQIIAKSKINISELEEDLKITITAFNRKHNGYKMKPTENTSKELMALSNIISQHIYDYYVDKEDQEVDITTKPLTATEVKNIVEDIKDAEEDPKPAPSAEPAPAPTPNSAPTPAPDPVPTPTPAPAPVEEEPKNKNEKALYLLLKEGVTSGITKKMLKEKGFDTDIASIRGCKVGSYRLFKEFSDETYNLEKL